jgi:NADPH-dependent 2,4-dienoyl-CoA reductase/sulfur reductase-like enzyme
VEVSRCDSDWRPCAGTTTEIEADAVCLGFGLVPHLDIASSLGCEIRRLQDAPDFGVRVDAGQRTSVAGVYAAGETTGIGGARLAAFEGHLAALTAAFDHGLLGSRTFAGACARARTRMRPLQGLAEVLRRAYAPRDGAWLLADSSTIVCRCEEVAESTVAEALGETDSSVLAIKAMTRLGMGPCQGRVCMPHMIERLRITQGRDPSQQLGLWRVRQPLRPIPLKALADVANGAW